MNNTVWILNHYAGDTFFDKGGRHYWMAKCLLENGYSPVVFCCNNKHNPGTEEWFDTKQLWIEKYEENSSVPYVFVRGRRYVGNGKQRVLNMIDFYHNVKETAAQYTKEHPKPDVILSSSVHPFTLLAGIQLAKKYGVKCICEIRDLWPESLVAYGISKRSSFSVKMLRMLEKWCYMKADALVFTMEGAYDYIIDQGWQKKIPKNKVFFVNNGIDLQAYKYNKEHYKIEDEDLDNTLLYKVIYTGSIRKVNKINKLLDVAKSIVNPDVRFLIWGDGDELEKLIERQNSETITNVVFKGRVDKKFIPYITSCADLNYAHNDSSPLFSYGISFNKIFDYLAAGKPILCDFESKYNPVIENHAGVEIQSEDPKDIAREIDRLSMLPPDELDAISTNARDAAQLYDVHNLASKIIAIIENMDK